MIIIYVFIFQPFPGSRAESPERRHRPSRYTGIGESRHRDRDGGPSGGRDRTRSRSPLVPHVTGTEFTEVK